MLNRVLTLILLLSVSGVLSAQQPSAAIKRDHLTPKLSVLDAGCNIAICQAESGRLIDSGNPEPAGAVQAAIRALDSRGDHEAVQQMGVLHTRVPKGRPMTDNS